MISIGQFEFSTKKKAEDHVRLILGRHRNLQAISGGDLEFVKALVSKHPNRTVVEDCGISCIQVQWLDAAGVQRRFLAVRVDGSIRDFTWRHAIYPRNALDSVRRVCRSLIAPIVEAFRRLAFGTARKITCPVSGLEITADRCDVDHAAPNTFAVLVDGWLLSIGATAEDLAIIPSSEYQKPDVFQDVFMSESWIEYHGIHARLRVVHPTANRSLLRRKS